MGRKIIDPTPKINPKRTPDNPVISEYDGKPINRKRVINTPNN